MSLVGLQTHYNTNQHSVKYVPGEKTHQLLSAHMQIRAEEANSSMDFTFSV